MKAFCQLQRKQTRYRTQRNEIKKHNFFGYHPEVFLLFLFSFSLLESLPLAPLCPTTVTLSLFFLGKSSEGGTQKKGKRKGEKIFRPDWKWIEWGEKEKSRSRNPPFAGQSFPGEGKSYLYKDINFRLQQESSAATPNLPEK